MIIIGLDLSGPSNYNDTALTIFKEKTNCIELVEYVPCADDFKIHETIEKLPKNEVIAAGLDAPLSYNNGGGDRPSDSALRKLLVEKGMKSGSVMTPTMTRMAYLTLRGISVARLIEKVSPDIKIAEVHPGGIMLLRGAKLSDVKGFKKEMDCRMNLIKWLGKNGLKNIDGNFEITDHYVASCACALGAYRWMKNDLKWFYEKEPVFHPYDLIL